MPRAKKPRKDKGKPVKDHGLWLKAVNAIHDRMERGAHRYDAVTEVAELREFASLHITGASYPWWAKRFRDQGLISRNFVGGTNLSPQDRAAAQLNGLQKCVALDKAEENNGGGVKPVAESELHELIESLRNERYTLEMERDCLRGGMAALRNDLAILTLERDNLRVELEAKAKPAGIMPPPLRNERYTTELECESLREQLDRAKAEIAAMIDRGNDLAHEVTKLTLDFLQAKAKPAGIPPPPLGKGSNNVVTCRWQFSTDHGEGYIELVTEGVGYYVELKAEDPLKLDAAEFLALAQWADEACNVMDGASGEGKV